MRAAAFLPLLALLLVSCSHPPATAEAEGNGTPTAGANADGSRKDPNEEKVRRYVMSQYGERTRFVTWGPNDPEGHIHGSPAVRVVLNGGVDLVYVIDRDDGSFGQYDNPGGSDWIAYELRKEREGLRGNRAEQREKGWPRPPKPAPEPEGRPAPPLQKDRKD